jgi:ribosome-interacting GTPase 1
MPTNVTPQYKEAEARYRSARTVDEKIAALEDMLAIMPKHKGTDKLQADVKARLAKLRRESGKKGGARGTSHMVPREGAGQIVLVGLPNSGKSSLVAGTTHAEPKVGDYPFTTRDAVPGMMRFEDVGIQLVDLPPVSHEHVEPWVFDLIRRADLVWAVVAQESALEDLDEIQALLDPKHLQLVPWGSTASAFPSGGEPGLEIPKTSKPALLVVTGMDRPGGEANLQALRELLSWPMVPVSVVDARGLSDLARDTFTALDVIRVFTKEPGKPADRERPFTLKRGSTVLDLALLIHRELSESLRFARVWGRTVFDGQPVKGDHTLEDGDVVELHV